MLVEETFGPFTEPALRIDRGSQHFRAALPPLEVVKYGVLRSDDPIPDRDPRTVEDMVGVGFYDDLDAGRSGSGTEFTKFGLPDRMHMRFGIFDYDQATWTGGKQRYEHRQDVAEAEADVGCTVIPAAQLSRLTEREAADDQIGLGNRFYSEADAGADHIQPCFKLIPQPLACRREVPWVVGWYLDDVLM